MISCDRTPNKRILKHIYALFKSVRQHILTYLTLKISICIKQCEVYLYHSQYVRHVFGLRFTQIKIGHFLLLLFFPFLTSPLYVK